MRNHPRNPVMLLWLDKSHDVIHTRIHDEMSQPLCLMPTKFGNYKVLSHEGDAFSTSTYAAASLEMSYAKQHCAASIETPHTKQHSTASY
jgi:hypothetical protein